mmetsp:Transcript_10096/g.18126  ORF Transcript_10096/g.18126 Transcript_10096/m.18126 type:complete len:203 (+) Transcript_10096:206-814(+)|eukprot:CAMPEP_0201608646 /NCGR_PEP_ID=MMETSP0492-20130828/8505_1 /ASSEMBLY_ACC=CAM_ASM_000837 /TAXON_ID=420259 /ORGANISM="Thalassiosira gravida, Strain GMp14c1" /LENGTH=202 /DNA_ID=CAMNT_0048073539 /DNA_START=53 /DNA_END=661 /DNA_ORIENTATION=+
MTFELNPTETALVLIEYQNEFTSEGGKLHEAVKPCMESNNMLENSSKLMAEMRSKGCTVMHVPIVFEKGHKEIGAVAGILAGIAEGKTFESETWNAKYHPSMEPAADDINVNGKLGLCGFHSTNLDFLLRQRGIKNVVIGGFLTNCCVESTMRAAYERGFQVYTLKDCTAAMSVEAHEGAFEHSFGLFSTPTNSAEVTAALA